MSTVQIEKHPSWNMAREVHEITKPLFQYFNINYFDFARFYKKNNEVLVLYSDPAWVAYFLNDPSYINPASYLKKGNHLWESYIPPEIIKIANTQFNHKHGITFHYDHEKYHEIFNFSAAAENYKILQLYSNKIEVLQKFCAYFIEKAAPLIEKLEKQKIILPAKTLITPSSCLIVSFEKKCEDFLNSLGISSLYSNQILTFAKEKKITARELDCLHHLSKGLTAKEIGKTLKISHRTVETHLQHIKEKAGCRKIIEIFSEIKKII
ncbi:MAG: hypothetical protein A3I12_03000 [Gammaproteobacteria bacterium RIFCSPLOWO2_02_FULL_38_11]|nr:MAG: hypothetical protein A3I12_03000 [Gammaproteobacteria bacterium RIFCSPLOWO2_02_FULL_38_11]